MYYYYDPKDLTMEEKAEAHILADKFQLSGDEKAGFISSFYAGLQWQKRKDSEEAGLRSGPSHGS
jgi:hypothetical protein